MSLLEEAKKIVVRRKDVNRTTDEDIELVIAYFDDEITLKQVAEVVNKTNASQVYNYLSVVLREAWRKGVIGKMQT